MAQRINIDRLPSSVNDQLSALVDDVRLYVMREREAPTAGEARDTLSKIELQALELQAQLEALDHTPRAHLVANLPRGALSRIAEAVTLLCHAAHAASPDIPRHKGNAQTGVPRYAAMRVVDIFKAADLRISVVKDGAAAPSLAMDALDAVLTAAGRPLSRDSIVAYLSKAKRAGKEKR